MSLPLNNFHIHQPTALPDDFLVVYSRPNPPTLPAEMTLAFYRQVSSWKQRMWARLLEVIHSLLSSLFLMGRIATLTNGNEHFHCSDREIVESVVTCRQSRAGPPGAKISESKSALESCRSVRLANYREMRYAVKVGLLTQCSAFGRLSSVPPTVLIRAWPRGPVAARSRKCTNQSANATAAPTSCDSSTVK